MYTKNEQVKCKQIDNSIEISSGLISIFDTAADVFADGVRRSVIISFTLSPHLLELRLVHGFEHTKQGANKICYT